eukprot:5659951-Ditylum_brightwellii.AAC.1
MDHTYGITTNAGIQTFASVRRLLGNLRVEDMDVNYWITAINAGAVMIATDGSVADKRGYFAVVLFTTEQTIRYQGTCDGAHALM